MTKAAHRSSFKRMFGATGQTLTALAALMAAACASCAQGEQRNPNAEQGDVMHYRLLDRAVSPVPGAPASLNIAVPADLLDTRISSPPKQGDVRAVFVSIPSALAPSVRYFCRMTYSSPDPIGAVGDQFAVDETLARRFGLPDGFNCRRGADSADRRLVTYYCEDPRARLAGGQLETRCHFENPSPTATCIVSVRIPSRAYLDCEYAPRDVSRIRSIAETVSERADTFVRSSPTPTSRPGE